jgi:ATP-binding cassette subfamily B protein
MRKSQANILFISQWPRYIVEGLGMALIALITFLLTKQDGSLTDAIPFLGALALGAQRMLPIVQQAYASWTSIYGSHAQLRETLLLLDQRMPEHATEQAQTPLHFQRGVSLVGVDFQYSPAAPWIFRGLNLFIPKGSRVGVIGETGSGKSTMLDILMGLLVPKEGVLKVDDIVITEANRRCWQSAIAHVPQFIFLTDSSAAENIAFGITSDEINIDRVKEAAHRAQIAELIESWPEGYETKLGERGIKLSGGQRQRIGIARALYKRAEMIIFDEATSALDSQTEDAVMNAIRSLGNELTLIIIAHRLTTLNICDQVIEVGDQGLLRKGSYAEIVDTKIFKDASS